MNDGIYDELMKRSTSFLKGNSQERRLLPLLYLIDDVEKWDDIEELKKSNPNLGVSVPKSFYEDEIIVARNSLSKKAEFLTKYCNIKQNSSVAWLDYVTVDKCGRKQYAAEDFKNCYGVGGIDLSQTTDLTAACIVIEKNGELYCFSKFFLPSSRVEEAQARDNVPYEIFIKQGAMQLSGTNYIDYRDVCKWFLELRSKYQIIPLQTGYDRYSAQYLIDEMKGKGYKMDDVHQGENLTPVILEFEGILKDEKFHIDNNLMKAHFLNVALKQNTETRKVRPVKLEARSRIDGFVSVIDAMTVRQKYFKTYRAMLENRGK